MSSACHEYTKRINDWRRNRKTIELLEIASEVLHLPIEASDAGKPASEEMNCLLYRIRSGGSDVVEIGNQIQGYYIHPGLFHSFAEWISPEYGFKVSRLMNLINERNQLINQTLEQTIENLNQEINDLKAKNESKNHSLNELEVELVSRAVKIEELASEIEDLTTPIDARLAPPTVYAKYIDDNYVQLKHSSSELGPNVRTLRRESFNGAIECLKQAKSKLKEEGLLVNINGKLLIENTHIDKVFDLIHEIKDRKNESRTDRSTWFESQLSKLRTREQTPQLEGKIFELEYIQQHKELTPWALVPTDIKNRLNETSKDKGIDAVELTNEGEFLSIIQIKHHRGNYLRKDELQTFFNKCSQERYKNVKKRLLLYNCKVSDKLKNMIHSRGIEIEVLLN